jgi:hypothetical protein
MKHHDIQAYWGVEVEFHVFLTSSLGALPSGKLHRRLDLSQSLSGCCGEEKNICLWRESNYRFPITKLVAAVTIPTGSSWPNITSDIQCEFTATQPTCHAGHRMPVVHTIALQVPSAEMTSHFLFRANEFGSSWISVVWSTSRTAEIPASSLTGDPQKCER